MFSESDMYEHMCAFVASFLLSIQRGWNVHVRSKKQCPDANFSLHFNSKQEATKENPEKIIYTKQLFYTLEINIY